LSTPDCASATGSVPGMPSALLRPFALAASDAPVTIVRGEGAVVWDKEGRRYLDGMASLWYCQVGHGRREIRDAMVAQMELLEAFHLFEIFTNEPAEALAAAVAERTTVPDARVFFTCSGSEAIEAAIKLARLSHVLRGEPHRTVVVGRQRSYHGTAYGGTSIQGLTANQEGFGPLLPDVAHVAFDDLGELETLFAAQGDRIAAVVAEPVIGAGGVWPAPPGYFAGVRKLCDDYGALLVLDEVITGFGRLGTWFGAERLGVVPDLQVFAKGVTSGYQPVGGVVVGSKVREPLEADPTFVLRHGQTYSGHPTACAAGLANLALLTEEELLARAPRIGARLSAGLSALRSDGLVGDVRGEGAMWAVGLHEGHDVVAARQALLERGVIARVAPDSSLVLCPPLVMPDDDVDRCVEALAEAIHATAPAVA
jgi:putrescine aminotransferase